MVVHGIVKGNPELRLTASMHKGIFNAVIVVQVAFQILQSFPIQLNDNLK